MQRKNSLACLIKTVGFVGGICVGFHENALAQDTNPDGSNPAALPYQPKVFLNLNIRGKVPDDVRRILERLVEPDDVAKTITAVRQSGKSLTKLCASVSCPPLKQPLQLAQAAAAESRKLPSNIKTPVIEAFRTVTGLGSTGSTVDLKVPERYALFAAESEISAAAGLNSGDLAVPESALELAGLLFKNDKLELSATPKTALNLIAADVKSAGYSERSFSFNPLLSEDEKTRLLNDLAVHGDSVSFTSGEPVAGFTFIQFNTTGKPCAASPPTDWPFDADGVSKTIEFDKNIMQRLGLTTWPRARILIVDTGVGADLARKALSPVIYATPAELFSATEIKLFNGKSKCVDADGNGYWHDVYGAGADARMGELEDRSECPSLGDALEGVAPFQKKATATQLYYPDHGGFVGVLAAGGPRLLASQSDLGRFLGLSFYRITRASDSDTMSVRTESNDIDWSLKYANTIQADVVNMSLQTAKVEPFTGFFASSGRPLLVVSAGNFGEDLDNGDPAENRPAALDDKMMIVVAALKTPDAIWDMSAHGPQHIHIAAPGVDVGSYDSAGHDVCDSGTSASAPLVSFASAMVRALTGARPDAVRSRVLAAADNLSALEGSVEEGRRLNIAAALDIFVDQVRLQDDPHGRRGWIEPGHDDAFFAVCNAQQAGPLAASRGGIDLSQLWEWQRSTGNARIRRYVDSTASGVFTGGSCGIPSGSFQFFDLNTGKSEPIEWSKVVKIIPTHFRRAKEVIMNSDRRGVPKT